MIAAPIITVDQAAELLGCEPGTLEAQLAGGSFTVVKVIGTAVCLKSSEWRPV